MAKAPPLLKPKAPKRAPPAVATAPAAPTKTFTVEPWTGAGEGEKIIGYGRTGMGKTTLFSMMPNPIFLGLDDGGRRIVNPKTGEPINHIPEIETYEDVRTVLHQATLFPKGSSCVIDTMTLLEQLAERHVLETIPLPRGGRANNIKAYGYNAGSSHLLDAMRLILQDLDALIRRGVNVGLVCQEHAISISNPEGLDYRRSCPRLHHDNNISIVFTVCEWADHIMRINYLNTRVQAEGERLTGKIAPNQDSTRAVFIGGAQDFEAKSRTGEKFTGENGERVEQIAFADPSDDTFWTFLFPEE